MKTPGGAHRYEPTLGGLHGAQAAPGGRSEGLTATVTEQSLFSKECTYMGIKR